MADSVITSDEIFEEEAKTATTIFYEKNAIYKKKNKILYSTCLFISYHYIIDSC